MLLYHGIITLDYDPTTDVLLTSMPDVKEFTIPQVSFCLELIVDSIRNYDIKNLLLDASHSIIEVEAAAYIAITKKFTLDLMTTRLKKLARIGTTDTKREERSAQLSSELKQEVNLSVKIQSFTSQAEALAWLLAS